MKQKNKKEDFRKLGNLLIGKGILKADSGNKKGK